MLPERHERQAETQDRLQAVAKQVGLTHLPTEPEEDMLEAFQQAVDDAFQHLGYAEA